jgi:hypothetical protein
MPINSRVHKVFKALTRDGHSEQSAAKIAQAVTGRSLQTGKPPKQKSK